MPELILDSIFFSDSNFRILNGCHLKAEKGNIIGLLGENGSGKSTLLKIAAGQLLPDSGITIIDKERLHKKFKPYRYSKLAYLPQKSFLLDNLRVEKVLETINLEYVDDNLIDVKREKIKDLSTGIRRYLEIVFILSFNKDYVILDEPFTGLSPILIEKVIDKINSHKSKSGFIICDHYIRYILDLVDKVYLMNNGVCTPVSNLEKFKKGLL